MCLFTGGCILSSVAQFVCVCVCVSGLQTNGRKTTGEPSFMRVLPYATTCSPELVQFPEPQGNKLALMTVNRATSWAST